IAAEQSSRLAKYRTLR
ncbi:putative Dolichyl-diphosphooligosaccharide--protein, partial [Naja naja]